jgi:hypothetical protein
MITLDALRAHLDLIGTSATTAAEALDGAARKTAGVNEAVHCSKIAW